jgi:chemotaxis protein methyltransferase CheR
MSTLAPAEFDFVCRLVRQNSAIVLGTGKEYLVESRLSPLARSHGVADVRELVHVLQRQPVGRLADQVVEAMTTNETSFFRDQHPFTALSTTVLPDLMRTRAAARRLSIWCGASSAGQEPYSIAMLVRQAFERQAGWSASVLATDLSPLMLARTKEGRYSQLEVNRGLPAPMLVKWFDRVGTQFQVKQELRAMVETRPLNLAERFPPIGMFDVVFLRNVLIYFDPPMKKQVLQRVRQVLRPDGLLFLGAAETTLTIDDAWERVAIDRATAYRPCR